MRNAAFALPRTQCYYTAKCAAKGTFSKIVTNNLEWEKKVNDTFHFAAEKNHSHSHLSLPDAVQHVLMPNIKYELQRNGDLTVVMPTIEMHSSLLDLCEISER